VPAIILILTNGVRHEAGASRVTRDSPDAATESPRRSPMKSAMSRR
jgi:hypothetical protein